MKRVIHISAFGIALILVASLTSACGPNSQRGETPAARTSISGKVKAGIHASQPISSADKAKVRAESKKFLPSQTGKTTVELIAVDKLADSDIPDSTLGTLSLGIEEAQKSYNQTVVAKISRGKDDSVYVIWRKNPGETWKPSE